jgi:hypothetical protein
MIKKKTFLGWSMNEANDRAEHSANDCMFQIQIRGAAAD